MTTPERIPKHSTKGAVEISEHTAKQHEEGTVKYLQREMMPYPYLKLELLEILSFHYTYMETLGPTALDFHWSNTLS